MASDAPYRWHACPVTGLAPVVDPSHLAAWERFPAPLRAELVNAFVREDHDVEAAGWPSPDATRVTVVCDRVLAAIAAHLGREPPRWLRPLAWKIAEGVRDRCGYCMASPRPQAALPGLWAPPPKAPVAAPTKAAAPAAPPGVPSTKATLDQLRAGLAGLRKKT